MDLKEFKKYFKQQNLTAMVVKDEEIIFESKKAGVSPLVELIEEHSSEDISDSYVFDKVIGKAAALLICFFEGKWVFTTILSRSARDVLKKNKIPYEVEQIVEKIIPPGEKTQCPFEKAVSNIRDPQVAYEVIKTKLNSM